MSKNETRRPGKEFTTSCSESIAWLQPLREPKVIVLMATSRSTLRANIKDGYFVPPVKICSGRAVIWPQGEVISIIRARIAGKSNEEIRCLVQELIAARKAVAPLERKQILHMSDVLSGDIA